MSTRILRPALLATLAFFLVAALTLTFSPAARAAVQAIFSFNGVTVSIDDETGELVASGNTGAIVQQCDDSITIQGEDGSLAGVVVADLSLEILDVTELLERYPDLVLPDVPQGYTLAPQGQLSDDGALSFTWTNAAGQMINYLRSSHPPENIVVASVIDDAEALPGDQALSTGDAYPITAVVSGTGTDLEFPQGDLEMLTVEASNSLVSYSWESDGYFHILFATDPELSEADLQAMLP